MAAHHTAAKHSVESSMLRRKELKKSSFSLSKEMTAAPVARYDNPAELRCRILARTRFFSPAPHAIHYAKFVLLWIDVVCTSSIPLIHQRICK